MSITDDLLLPFESLIEAPRTSMLAYLAWRLHADGDGICMKPYWVAALCGLHRVEREAALEDLERRGCIERFKHEGLFGYETGVRLTHWKCPTRQTRLTGSQWQEIRSRVFERDDYTCAYCNQVFNAAELECDHIEPISAGGTNELGNLITACTSCNRKKHAKIVRLHQRTA